MNRCFFRMPLVALALASATAHAQVAMSLSAAASTSTTTSTSSTESVTSSAPLNIRQFPKNAQRGELLVGVAPDIRMNDKVDRLSPAVRIRDANNNLILSGTLSGKKVVVNYVRDNIGLVQQVWILNAQEAKLKMPGDGEMTIMSTVRSVFDAPARPRVADDGKTPYDQLPKY